MQTKEWFLDNIGNRIYRDVSFCDCLGCKEVNDEGIIITDKQHAIYLYTIENDFGSEGSYLNYRLTK